MADTRWWLHPQHKDTGTSIWESSWETIKIEEYAKMNEFKAVSGDTSQKAWSEDEHMFAYENPEKLYSEMEPELTGINKTGPWWCTTDLNDLASFVSERSLQHFGPPQTLKSSEGQRVDSDKGPASLDQVTNFAESMPKSANLIGIGESCVPCGLDDTSGEAENLRVLSKAEMLEALCHSQTRAREAEKAARKVYNEKEHMITLFLKQASQLFAYKQWLHILQLETACLHLRSSKCQLVYTLFPDFVPWVDTEDAKKVLRKAVKRKRGSPRYKLCKSFGRVVLSLSLVGAGLLLGWTLGWLSR
ncbi:uncharacterized protein [Rutidosis leptorrhynchoides]|uniref:uncharacterized protein n=1 Tax=Rutidosis leptorrhynchoides TaxID=125765 RepID=UPI003A9A523A